MVPVSLSLGALMLRVEALGVSSSPLPPRRLCRTLAAVSSGVPVMRVAFLTAVVGVLAWKGAAARAGGRSTPPALRRLDSSDPINAACDVAAAAASGTEAVVALAAAQALPLLQPIRAADEAGMCAWVSVGCGLGDPGGVSAQATFRRGRADVGATASCWAVLRFGEVNVSCKR